MNINRLNIDYEIIKKLDSIVEEIDICIHKCDWGRKKELDKLYFEIYDQLDVAHKEYIEQKKDSIII